MNDLPPPGWYDDPTSPVQQRWWDGERWSEQTRGKPKPGPQSSPGQLSRMGDLLSETFNLIGARWDDLLLVAVFAGVVQGLAAVSLLRPIAVAVDVVNNQILGWGPSQTILLVSFVLVALAITLTAAMAHYKILWQAALDEPSRWSSALMYGLATAPRVAGWGLVGLIPVAGGVALVVGLSFVARGLGGIAAIVGVVGLVWWGVVMSFVPAAIVANPAGSNPIVSALGLARGRWWKVFGRLILIGLIMGIVTSAVGAIVGQFTGTDFFGFVVTDVGNGDIEIAKDLDAPVGFFLSNTVIFVYSVASSVLQLAGITAMAHQVWRRPEEELSFEL